VIQLSYLVHENENKLGSGISKNKIYSHKSMTEGGIILKSVMTKITLPVDCETIYLYWWYISKIIISCPIQTPTYQTKKSEYTDESQSHLWIPNPTNKIPFINFYIPNITLKFLKIYINLSLDYMKFYIILTPKKILLPTLNLLLSTLIINKITNPNLTYIYGSPFKLP